MGVRNSTVLAILGLLLIVFVIGPAARQTPSPVPSPTPAETTVGPALVPVVPVPGTQSSAVQVHEVPSPAGPDHWPAQAMWALCASYLMQWAKKSKWFTWLTPETTAAIQTRIGFIVALLTAAGIHFAVSGNLLDGEGAQITVTGLSLNAIKDVVFQWASQQAAYDVVVRRLPSPTPTPQSAPIPPVLPQGGV